MDSEASGSQEQSKNYTSGGPSEVAIVFSTTSQRCKVQEGGYFYVFDKMSTDGRRKFWRCERKSSCNARIHTDAVTNEILKRPTPHNHPPNMVRSAALPRVLKRRLDGESSQASEEVSAKRCASPLGIIPREIMNTTGSDPMERGMPLQNLKKECVETAAADSWYMRPPFSEALTSFSKPGFSESAAIVDGNSATRIINNSSRSSAEHNETDVTVQQPPSISNSSGSDHPEMAETEQSVGNLDIFFNGGLIIWNNEITKILEEGEQFCKMALNSNLSKRCSLLIKGAENSGKSCLAALIAKHASIPYVKICHPESMLRLSEEEKRTKLIDLFDEADHLPKCLILLDGIELLIGFCEVGNRYSNTVLQTLKLLLKKARAPSEDNRLVVIATATSLCAEKFALQHCFSICIEVPLLSRVEHLMAVIEDSNIFATKDCKMFAECLAHETNSYSVGIKNLLTAIEMVKNCGETNRFRTLFRKLSLWKQ